MPTLVVPFRGAQGKSRLGLPTSGARAALVEAMLADVLAACAPVGPTFVVAPVLMDAPGVTSVDDPGRGQGAAVEAGLDAAVVAGASAPFLVLNADLPCVTPRDLFALAGSVPAGGIAVAAAADGTTNASVNAGELGACAGAIDGLRPKTANADTAKTAARTDREKV